MSVNIGILQDRFVCEFRMPRVSYTFPPFVICTFNTHLNVANGTVMLLKNLYADVKSQNFFHTCGSQWIIISEKPQINIS